MKSMLTVLFSLAFSFLFGQEIFSVGIEIPQNSGLAAVDYEVYTVKNDTLYVERSTLNPARLSLFLDQSANESEDTLPQRIYTPLRKYAVTAELMTELKQVIAATDTLRYESGCMHIGYGNRFFIYFNDHGRKRSGFVANVYRAYVFAIVDVLNKITPEPFLGYDKSYLLLHESDCQ